MIAGAPDKIMESCAFSPKNKDAVAGEVELVIIGRSALVETDDPEVLLLQVLERPHKVDHACNPEVLGGARASLHSGRTQRSGAPLCQNNTVHSRPVRDTQQCSQVLRVFHSVEGQHQPGRPTTGDFSRRSEEIFNREELLRPDHGDHPLVRGGSCKLRELLSRLLPDAHACLAAVGNQPRKAFVLTLTGHDYVVKTASACLECLCNRMHSIEDFHEG